MDITLDFVKCSGAGNDFVLLDNFAGSLAADQPSLARALCSRPFGVGADGLLVVERSGRADFAMKYYNADGSYGGMCGNGGRCIAMYAFLAGHAGRRMRFEALDFIYEAEVIGEQVKLSMKEPGGYRPDLELALGRGSRHAHFIDTGSPHLVVFIEELDHLEVQSEGRELRYHPAVMPAGANVNFVAIEGSSTIALRTYERGVESETLACGTGSVASAIVSCFKGHCRPPVTVKVRSGEELCVDFESNDGRITGVTLQGSAHIVFAGKAIFNTTSSHLLPYPVRS